MFKKPAFPIKNPQAQSADTPATTTTSAVTAPGSEPKASSSFAAWKQRKSAATKMPPPSLPPPQKMPPPQQISPPPQKIPNDIPKVDYTAPKWACCPPKYPYYLEVLKNGVITRTIDISKKDHYVMGRLPTCDIPLENPSISRYHLVIQHKRDGRVLVYDLGSTHKTRINKHTIAPRTYTYYLTGDILKLGESTQLYVLGGGPPREEVMQELTAEEEKAKTQGCNWGMIGDDDEYDDEGEEEEELPGRKRLTLGFDGDNEDEDDKKSKKKGRNKQKSLKRKHSAGNNENADDDEYDNNYDDDNDGGSDDEQREVLVEKKFKKWETLENGERYIDSDDDEFFDRTGEVEKSKAKAIAREEREKGKEKAPEIMCYKDLLAKKSELETKLSGANEELSALRDEEAKQKNGDSDEVDSLDMFMSENNDSLRNDKIHVLEECIAALEKELAKTERYLAITKPTLQISAERSQRELEYRRYEEQLKEKREKQQTHAKVLQVNDFFRGEDPPKAPAKNKDFGSVPVQKIDQHQKQAPPQQQKRQSVQKPAQPKYDDVDDWVPPVGQSGDGFTSLNKKLGY